MWRDPYERLISYYKDLITHKGSHGGDCYADTEDGVFNNFINKFVLGKYYGSGEMSHTAKIVNGIYNKNILDKIDMFVHINKLSTFIEHELGVSQPIKRNVSKTTIDTSSFERYKDLIQEYYKDDYEYFSQNLDRFY